MRTFELKSGAKIRQDDLVEAMYMAERLKAKDEIYHLTPLPIDASFEEKITDVYLDIIADDPVLEKRKSDICGHMTEAAWLGLIRNHAGLEKLASALGNEHVTIYDNGVEMPYMFLDSVIVLGRGDKITADKLAEFCRKTGNKATSIQTLSGSKRTIVGIERRPDSVAIIVK